MRPILLLLLAAVLACGKKDAPAPSPVNPPVNNPPVNNPPGNNPPVWGYDFESKGIPQFAVNDYIELSKITSISKFRSGMGHDYSDNFEKCRSMKHYFLPAPNVDWASIKIYAPVNGTILKVTEEWAGKQVHITPEGYPDFSIIMFHVNLSGNLAAGSKLTAGQQIGTHIGNMTMSDITVGINTTKGWRLVSWFEVMKDEVFNAYKLRGVASRQQAIITREARDASPLSCSGETFANAGTLENWVKLN